MKSQYTNHNCHESEIRELAWYKKYDMSKFCFLFSYIHCNVQMFESCISPMGMCSRSGERSYLLNMNDYSTYPKFKMLPWILGHIMHFYKSFFKRALILVSTGVYIMNNCLEWSHAQNTDMNNSSHIHIGHLFWFLQ